MALDADSETFVMHVAIWKQKEMPVHLEKQAQVRVLLFNKAPIEVLEEYSDYRNVFLAENAAELPENIGMNEHAIKLEEGKQSPFELIYSLGPIELETLKTYIKINLTNGLICTSKYSAGAFILFNKKLDGSLRLCVDYCSLNNIIIKIQYPLPLIEKSFNWLGWAKRFT